MASGTVAAVIVAAAGVWVAFWQTRLTRASVELTERSVKVAEAALRAASDPVISLAGISRPAVQKDKTHLVRVDLQNVGGTPALVNVTMEFSEDGLKAFLGQAGTPQRQMIAPRQTKTFPLQIPSAFYDVMRTGGAKLEVSARVRYMGGTMREPNSRLFVALYDRSQSKDMIVTVDEGLPP